MTHILKVPALKPSVKVMYLRHSESFQPDVFYSTLAWVWCFLKRGYPFFPGLPDLQLSKKRAIADHALSAAAWRAIELRFLANSNCSASTAQYAESSYLPISLLSIQYLKQELRTNLVVRIASSSFSYCCFSPSSFASNTSNLYVQVVDVNCNNINP